MDSVSQSTEEKKKGNEQQQQKENNNKEKSKENCNNNSSSSKTEEQNTPEHQKNERNGQNSSDQTTKHLSNCNSSLSDISSSEVQKQQLQLQMRLESSPAEITATTTRATSKAAATTTTTSATTSTTTTTTSSTTSSTTTTTTEKAAAAKDHQEAIKKPFKSSSNQEQISQSETEKLQTLQQQQQQQPQQQEPQQQNQNPSTPNSLQLTSVVRKSDQLNKTDDSSKGVTMMEMDTSPKEDDSKLECLQSSKGGGNDSSSSSSISAKVTNTITSSNSKINNNNNNGSTSSSNSTKDSNNLDLLFQNKREIENEKSGTTTFDVNCFQHQQENNRQDRNLKITTNELLVSDGILSSSTAATTTTTTNTTSSSSTSSSLTTAREDNTNSSSSKSDMRTMSKMLPTQQNVTCNNSLSSTSSSTLNEFNRESSLKFIDNKREQQQQHEKDHQLQNKDITTHNNTSSSRITTSSIPTTVTTVTSSSSSSSSSSSGYCSSSSSSLSSNNENKKSIQQQQQQPDSCIKSDNNLENDRNLLDRTKKFGTDNVSKREQDHDRDRDRDRDHPETTAIKTTKDRLIIDSNQMITSNTSNTRPSPESCTDFSSNTSSSNNSSNKNNDKNYENIIDSSSSKPLNRRNDNHENIEIDSSSEFLKRIKKKAANSTSNQQQEHFEKDQELQPQNIIASRNPVLSSSDAIGDDDSTTTIGTSNILSNVGSTVASTAASTITVAATTTTTKSSSSSSSSSILQPSSSVSSLVEQNVVSCFVTKATHDIKIMTTRQNTSTVADNDDDDDDQIMKYHKDNDFKKSTVRDSSIDRNDRSNSTNNNNNNTISDDNVVSSSNSINSSIVDEQKNSSNYERKKVTTSDTAAAITARKSDLTPESNSSNNRRAEPSSLQPPPPLPPPPNQQFIKDNEVIDFSNRIERQNSSDSTASNCSSNSNPQSASAAAASASATKDFVASKIRHFYDNKSLINTNSENRLKLDNEINLVNKTGGGGTGVGAGGTGIGGTGAGIRTGAVQQQQHYPTYGSNYYNYGKGNETNAHSSCQYYNPPSSKVSTTTGGSTSCAVKESVEKHDQNQRPQHQQQQYGGEKFMGSPIYQQYHHSTTERTNLPAHSLQHGENQSNYQKTINERGNRIESLSSSSSSSSSSIAKPHSSTNSINSSSSNNNNNISSNSNSCKVTSGMDAPFPLHLTPSNRRLSSSLAPEQSYQQQQQQQQHQQDSHSNKVNQAMIESEYQRYMMNSVNRGREKDPKMLHEQGRYAYELQNVRANSGPNDHTALQGPDALEYQRYLSMYSQEKEREYQRQKIYNKKSQMVGHIESSSSSSPLSNQKIIADRTEGLNPSNHMSAQSTNFSTRSSGSSSTGFPNTPSPIYNQTAEAIRRPSPVLSHHTDVMMRRPSPVHHQGHSEAMRRPSPVQNYTEAMRRPSPAAEIMRRPSPIQQNHVDAIRRPSPVQMNSIAQQNHSLYISNPDFSKQIASSTNKQKITSSSSSSSSSAVVTTSNHDLSPLHMKPPDFSKAAATSSVPQSSRNQISPQQQQQQQQQQHETKSKEKMDCCKQNTSRQQQITQQNFAEISRKFNYISDLQLKNPPPGAVLEEKSANGGQSAKGAPPYNNLYVKAPDFSTEKFQSKSATAAAAAYENSVYEQQHHAYQLHSAKLSNDPLYARQFPQLSHDVELSVVPQKNPAYHPSENTKAYAVEKPGSYYSEYQNYNKTATGYPQELVNKGSDKSVKSGNTVNDQYKREMTNYPSRTGSAEYQAMPLGSTARDPYQQQQSIPPSRQPYPSSSETKILTAARSSEPQHQLQRQQSFESTPRYDAKAQQNSLSQSHHKDSFNSYNYPQSTPSVIQSSKAKNYYTDYPHPTQSQTKSHPADYTAISPAHRQTSNSSYYMTHPNAVTPPTPPNSANSIPSSSQVTNTPRSSYPTSQQIQQQQQQQQQQQPSQQTGSNPPSPACQSQGSYKTTPSPGAMNPPYGWPSQTCSRVPPQNGGPSVSPHAMYRQPSPLGMNAPSPHSHSPSFLQPSPKPSPSPTNSAPRPSPQATTTPAMHSNYKSPYISTSPVQNVPAYYQQGDPIKGAASNPGYMMKTDKPPLDKNPYPTPPLNQYSKPPSDPKYDHNSYRPIDVKQDLRSNEYVTPPPMTATAYGHKSNTSKRMDYPEYPPAIPPTPGRSRNDSMKSSYKYATEAMTRPEYHSMLGKANSDLCVNKANQKPNYREMINHVYAIRNATSETELNAEIIKRTLKKDITRRSDSDLSKSIFDCTDPTKNCGYLARSVPTEDPAKRMDNYMGPKYSNLPYDPSQRRPSYPEATIPKSKSTEHLDRRSSIPLCNELARNDISVTVSKVTKPSPAPVEKSKSLERTGAYSLHSNYPSTNEFSSVVISKVNSASNLDQHHPVPPSIVSTNQKTKEISRTQTSVGGAPVMPSAAPPIAISKPTTSVFTPLDLSVKTVKTKADSTGCDDGGGGGNNSYQYNRASSSTASALKFDFAPNFSKHTIGEDNVSRTNVQAAPSAGAPSGPAISPYDSRYPNHIQSAHNNRSSSGSVQPTTTGSQNRSIQQQQQQQPSIQQSNSIPVQSTNQQHQYPLMPHHPGILPSHPPVQQSPQQNIPSEQLSGSFRTPPNHYPANIRPEEGYPSSHHRHSRDVSNYPFQQQQPNAEQKSTMPIIAHHQQQASLPATAQLRHEQKLECQKQREGSLYHPSSSGGTYPSIVDGSKPLSPFVNPYLQGKRESETIKQNIVPTPALPNSLYDKKSDDYLVNPLQHQRKISEKVAREVDLSKIPPKPTELPPPLVQQKYPEPQSSNYNHDNPAGIRHGSSYMGKGSRPDLPPTAIMANHIDQRYPIGPNIPSKQHYPADIYHPSNYDRSKYSDIKMEENISGKKIDAPKSLSASSVHNNLAHDQYAHYASAAAPPEPYKPSLSSVDYSKAQSSSSSSSNYKSNAIPERSDPTQDRFRTNEYHRKRPPEPAHNLGKSAQPPDKRIRVDELYRAHLEETYRQQQQKQQLQRETSTRSNAGGHHHPPNQFEKRDMSVIQPTSEATKSESSTLIHGNYPKANHQNPAPSGLPDQYGYQYKDGYQHHPSSIQKMNKESSTSHISSYPPQHHLSSSQQQQQQQHIWYSPPPQSHPKDKLPSNQDEPIHIKRESYPGGHHPPQNSSNYSSSDTERSSRLLQQQQPQQQQEQKRQIQATPEIAKKEVLPPATVSPSVPLNTSSSSSTISTSASASASSNSNVLRGADQNVISKLRTSIEMREYEKQRSSLLKKQSSIELGGGGGGGGGGDDDTNKSDIASLIAARIRTKGELKGFTPLPQQSSAAIKVKELERESTSPPPPPIIQQSLQASTSSSSISTSERKGTPPMPIQDPFAENTEEKSFDLLDWGTACNDFVEQLLTGGSKKRPKKSKKTSTTKGGATGLSSESAFESREEMPPNHQESQNTNNSKMNYHSDSITDDKKKIEEKIKTEPKDVKMEMEQSQENRMKSKPIKDAAIAESSSDEDKPLLHLRQQKSSSDLNDSNVSKSKKLLGSSRGDNSISGGGAGGSDTIKSQDSDSTLKSKRSIVEKLNEKINRNLREKQRLEQERRLAARLSKTSSSSDSDDDIKRNIIRQKKPRKTRSSRGSNGSTRDLSPEETDDSSGSENKIIKRNLMIRQRIVDAKKRRRIERLSSDSEDSDVNNEPMKISAASASRKKSSSEKDCCNNSRFQKKSEKEAIAIPSIKKEMITKARVKCMKLSSQSSSNSSDENDRIKPVIHCKRTIESPQPKKSHLKKSTVIQKEHQEESDEDEEGHEHEHEHRPHHHHHHHHSKPRRSSSPCKPKNKRILLGKNLIGENFKETMTRSKRKKELEQKIANSKILRNDKVVQNVSPSSAAASTDKKSKNCEKTPSKNQKTPEKSTTTTTHEEKPTKMSTPNKSGKFEKTSHVLKRKRSGNDSDEAGSRKRRFTKEEISPSSSSESSKESEEETVSARVRTRRARLSNHEPNDNPETSVKSSKKSKHKEKQHKEDNSKNGSGSMAGKSSSSSKKSKDKTNKNSDPTATGTDTEKFPPGWELEVYHYKRALKVPPSLITIKGPVHHRVSTSLPDLDPHSSDASESFSTEISKNPSSGKFPKNDDIKQSSSSSQQHQSEQQQGQQQQHLQQPKNSRKGGKSKKDNTTTQNSEIDLKKPAAAAADEEEQIGNPPKSIIDVLHSRVLKSKKLHKKNTKLNQSAISSISNNEPKILPRGSNEAELLPTPASVKDNKNPFANEHQNLFHTEVLKSRTRTEYRILKNKELIREVFGGEDRPASAPPEIGENIEELRLNTERITFDQKYQQYLQKMNEDFGEKIRKNRKSQNPSNAVEPPDIDTGNERKLIPKIIIKTEKLDEDETSRTALMNHHVDEEETQDTEINECFQTPVVTIKEEPLDAHERDTPSVTSEREGVVTPLIFKRRKGGKNRSGRRKGSSGFDYIRKKKKVPTNTNGTQDIVKRRRISPVELFHTRDENDVSKEIQKWVLNKSVGQSALHKAARLGYLDVIAYCLERLGMNPDPKDNAGYTPLHEACAKGRIDIARVLLQYGANHSETAHSGIRPLHEASENGYIEIARLLLSYGADPLLTTYSGQTPLLLAENSEMEQFLKNHLLDVQNTGPHKQPWKFPGPWKIYDLEEYGYNVFEGAPESNEEVDDDETLITATTTTTTGTTGITRTTTTTTTTPTKDIKCEINETRKISKEKCDTNSNIMINDNETKLKKSSTMSTTATELVDPNVISGHRIKNKTISSKCTVVLDNIDALDHINSVKQFNDCHNKLINRRRSTYEKPDVKLNRIPDESDGEGEGFEFEESDMPLPPLYQLKDEGSENWVLLSDLCNLLKVKSKDTLLKQLCPSVPPSTVNKELLRELKMSDFLERATCLQLLCAGEKLNISSSKVVLVKYNESVRNLLGVKTILMKF